MSVARGGLPRAVYGRGMCRSIRTLRPPFADDVTQDDVRAAAVQYVRKIAGMREPSVVNREAFEAAVAAVSAATGDLLAGITVRSSGPRATAPAPIGDELARPRQSHPS